MFSVGRSGVVTAWLAAVLLACGGGGTDDSGDGGGPGEDDYLILEVDGSGETRYTEAHSAEIECDPRVDWASSQLLLMADHTGTGPVQGFELLVNVLFGTSDDIGTYMISGGTVIVSYTDDTGNYQASPLYADSEGTILVTRSDTRIEGSFDIQLVDENEAPGPRLVSSGFGINRGNSVSCP